MSPQTDDVPEHHTEKLAHLFHELVDRVAHSTEYDRLALHDLVAECFGGVTKNQAADAVADPAAYAEARDAGAYDTPEPAQQPLTADQVQIQRLQAEIDAMRRGQVPNTPPEQSPATSTTPPFSAAPTPAAATAPTSTTPGPVSPAAPGQTEAVWGDTGAPPVTGAVPNAGPPEPNAGASGDTTTDGSATVTADGNAAGSS